MGPAIFWLTWTAISGVGIKFVAKILLDQEITFLQASITILVYQWISFIKLPEKNKQTNVSKNVNTNIVNTTKYSKKNK